MLRSGSALCLSLVAGLAEVIPGDDRSGPGWICRQGPRVFADLTSARDLAETVPDAERLTELKVGAATGTAHGRRAHARRAQRSGYCDRDWEACSRTVGLHVPKLRNGADLPGVLEPRRMAETPLTGLIRVDSDLGISTRSVDHLAKAGGMSGIANGEVSPCPGRTTPR